MEDLFSEFGKDYKDKHTPAEVYACYGGSFIGGNDGKMTPKHLF